MNGIAKIYPRCVGCRTGSRRYGHHHRGLCPGCTARGAEGPPQTPPERREKPISRPEPPSPDPEPTSPPLDRLRSALEGLPAGTYTVSSIGRAARISSDRLAPRLGALVAAGLLERNGQRFKVGSIERRELELAIERLAEHGRVRVAGRR